MRSEKSVATKENFDKLLIAAQDVLTYREGTQLHERAVHIISEFDRHRVKELVKESTNEARFY